MTIFFVHIPKTAGTALRTVLADVFEPAEKAFVYGPGALRGGITEAELAALPAEQKDALKLVFGHFHFGLSTRSDMNGRYVTMLRDPVDRIVSLYGEYERNRPDLLAGATLEEWVFGGTSLQPDNEMVRYVAGRRGIPYGGASEQMLAEAIDNLHRHFADVFFDDDMAGACMRLTSLLERPINPPLRVNAAPQRSYISQDLRDRIAELNRHDTALYNHARNRFGTAQEAQLVLGGTTVEGTA
jgi:hypothetical protein